MSTQGSRQLFEVALYDRALDASEVSLNFAAGSGMGATNDSWFCTRLTKVPDEAGGELAAGRWSFERHADDSQPAARRRRNQLVCRAYGVATSPLLLGPR